MAVEWYEHGQGENGNYWNDYKSVIGRAYYDPEDGTWFGKMYLPYGNEQQLIDYDNDELKVFQSLEAVKEAIEDAYYKMVTEMACNLDMTVVKIKR